MMKILRDMPDWMTGAAVAGLGWFGVCYTALAPRAMDGVVETEIIPSCTSALAQEQDAALAQAEKRALSEREQTVQRLQRSIAAKRGDLRLHDYARSEYERVNRALGGIVDMGLFPDLTQTLMSDEEVRDTKAALERQTAQLNNLPAIELPRVDAAGLAQTCGCAAAGVMNSARTEYAVSLASFRLVTPDEISTLKDDVSRSLRYSGSACGSKPWENLS